MSPENILLHVLVAIIGTVILLIWSAVGLYLWIPLLIRTAIAFSAAVVGSVVSGHSIANAEKALNEAIVLYAKGFTLIIESLRRILSGQLQATPSHTVHITWQRCIMEFVLATLMWFIPFGLPAGYRFVKRELLDRANRQQETIRRAEPVEEN